MAAEVPASKRLKTEQHSVEQSIGSTAKADRYEKLRAKVENNKWDTESWTQLIAEATFRGNAELIVESYNLFLKQFPTSARHWLSFIEFHMRNRMHDEVEAIFGQCLRATPDIDLWKSYLSYIRRLHPVVNVSQEEKQEARNVITKAYEFVLQNIGMDKDSGAIWSEYIAFIKAGDTSTEGMDSLRAEQTRMDQLRKIYQRAIAIPMNSVEQIWKEYDAFEHSLNRITAKKFISDHSARYMNARTSLLHLRSLLSPIAKQTRAYLAKPPTFSEKESLLLYCYKKWIAWEKSNPMKLEDLSVVQTRVVYAYKVALLHLRFWPEVWVEYANYVKSCGKVNECTDILKQACSINPGSLLVNFVYAEHLESLKKPFEEITPIFETIITHYQNEQTNITTKYDSEIAKLKNSNSRRASSTEEGTDAELDGERREALRKEEHKLDEKRKKELEDVRKIMGLVWCQYIKVARRCQGIKAARSVFGKARKADCSWQVYVASALMEHHVYKDANVARRVLELGWQNFTKTNSNLSEDEIARESISNYATAYIDFLIELNDDNNIRALFERALATLPVTHSAPLYNKFVDYENNYGDLSTIEKVEQRRDQVCGDDMIEGLETLARKYEFLDLKVVGEKELGLSALKSYIPSISKQLSSAESAVKLPSATEPKVHHPGSRGGLLATVHAERYQKPDLSKWEVYKVSAPVTVDSNLAPRSPRLTNASMPSVTSLLPSLIQCLPGLREESIQLFTRFITSVSDQLWQGPNIPDNVITTLLQTFVPSSASPTPVPIPGMTAVPIGIQQPLVHAQSLPTAIPQQVPIQPHEPPAPKSNLASLLASKAQQAQGEKRKRSG